MTKNDESKKVILRLDEVTKQFPIRRGLFRRTVGYIHAVTGVSLTLTRGTTHAVVGESGSGKSTLARLAVRLLEPTSGRIFYHGNPIEHLSRHQLLPYRKKMQMIFQDPISSLNPRKTIEESLGEGLILHGIVHSKEEMQERVKKVLEEVGLSSLAMRRYPHQFSGGQQQRLCIGRAIALEPDLIVADEAVSALDVSIQAQILNLLDKLQKERSLSYLFISHDLSVVRHTSDWITVMYLGKVMETGPTEEVFSNPKHPYTLSLLASTPKIHPKEKKEKIVLKGEIPSSANPPSGCVFRTRCPFAKEECKLPPPKKEGKNGHTYYCILDSVNLKLF